MLNASQVAAYRDNGYVLAEGLVLDAPLAAMRDQMAAWQEESRGFEANYGFDTVDGKARFDLQSGHSAERPRLRRVANPADVSDAFYRVMLKGPVVEAARDLLGPDLRFHHCKTNTKAPGAATKVDWHQDHAFTPLSNPDMVTVLILLDDMTPRNGCLRIVRGSHKERYSHFTDGRFIGMIDAGHHENFETRADDIIGRAGDVCFMHTWCVHGGGPNRSDRPRTLLIGDLMAADAVPLATNPVPSVHTGRVVAGRDLKTARMVAEEIELPEFYEDDSFFGLQEKAAAAQGAM